VRHWADRLISNGKCREIQFTANVSTLWNEIVKHVYSKYVESGLINPESDASYEEHDLTRESVIPIEGEGDGTTVEEIKGDE